MMRLGVALLVVSVTLGGCQGCGGSGGGYTPPVTHQTATPSPTATPPPTPTATPSPTPSPTATPAFGAVSPNPTSLSFLATGASYAQNLDVSQTNFTGSYGESDTCSGVVTVSVTSNSGGSAEYDVTPVGVGTCQITITGGASKQAVVGVTVTTTSVVIQRTR